LRRVGFGGPVLTGVEDFDVDGLTWLRRFL